MVVRRVNRLPADILNNDRIQVLVFLIGHNPWAFHKVTQIVKLLVNIHPILVATDVQFVVQQQRDRENL